MTEEGEDADWECLSQLGSGGFGIVHVWRSLSSGRCLALKKCKFGSEISLTARHREAWAREQNDPLSLDGATTILSSHWWRSS